MYSTLSKVMDEKSNYRVIDLRSDTLTLPTPEMRTAMAEAPVGDDVYGEDPTIRQLEEDSAKLFGKEAAVFVPSGTMANLIAIMIHCGRRGTEAICGDLAHTFLYEQGGAAYIAGVQLRTVANKADGTFCLDEFTRKIRGHDDHEPITSLVVVENTHNMCGGKIIPMEWMAKLAGICRENCIKMHMDGARVFNAAAALRLPVSEVVKEFDSVCYCLSKGLSAPVGSVLIGSKDFITEARRTRKALGGGMRQAGVLAAAGLVALEQVVPILNEDHRRIKQIAEAINAIASPNVSVDIDNVHTNILLIRMASTCKLSASDFAQRLATVIQSELDHQITDGDGKGIVVKLSARDWSFSRIVLYHQVKDEDVALTIKKLTFVINEIDRTTVA